MSALEGGVAFAALERLLSDPDHTDWSTEAQAVERLRVALWEEPQRASALDIAVLLRQALRHEHARRDFTVAPAVLVKHPRLMDFSGWADVGTQVRSSSAGLFVSALPWSPAWLDSGDTQGVDARAAAEVRCRFFEGQQVEGDPLLKSVNRTFYRSVGQRAAVRAALSTPPGGTTVVALPTGEGKSLIFQLAHSVGFTNSKPSDGRSVTLVIVPTVALGVNHQIEAVDICGLSPPLAYQGGNDVSNAQIIQKTADGSQGLCFASPEAACGALRSSLRKAAEGGYLRALVVDEAHLVDQWGTGFRTEFQELSGLRRELLAAAPPESQMRTLLLSATLTDSSLETLKSFFGGEENFESFSAVQLRPEPDYWVAGESSEQERVNRVLEAMHRVPRPCVLYVTEVADAEAWTARLLAAGFRRIAKLHGDTRRTEREEIVGKWRSGALDIVVGTSAFGLGIDYQHARSVVHACVPETLDRFYQEVGRGGRDGRASLSLIVPTKRDHSSAQGINRDKIIGIARGLERWSAMFGGKVSVPSGRYAVRIDGRPGFGDGDIDMRGDRNTDWNLRTLALMSRAKLIRMRGSPSPRLTAPGDWLEVDILEEGHLEQATWAELVEPVRAASAAASGRNLALMERFLADVECPASVLEALYGADRVGVECSRCSVCRSDLSLRRHTRNVGEPRSGWRAPSVNPDLARILGKDGRLLVTYDPESVNRKASRHLADCIGRLNLLGVSKLLCLGKSPFDMVRVLAFAERIPFFVSEVAGLVYSRLPRGPEIVLVGPGSRLEEVNLIPKPDAARIFIVPDEQRSFDGRRLTDVFGGRVFALEHFFARVLE
ncbi:ATP-dependent DNA helicase RecQ [Bradyrhizobium sp. S3.3.6]|uniref:protein DpdF n=1 Tax=Bradyrhizobium sp. S3.3.6 TaxID=3156429 RepID=UPI003391CCF9